MELNSGSCAVVGLICRPKRLTEVNKNTLVRQWDYTVYAIKCTGAFAISKGISGDSKLSCYP